LLEPANRCHPRRSTLRRTSTSWWPARGRAGGCATAISLAEFAPDLRVCLADAPADRDLQLAQDGVQFKDVNYQRSTNKSLLLAAGNRANMLVKAPTTPGTYEIQVKQTGASRCRPWRAGRSAMSTRQIPHPVTRAGRLIGSGGTSFRSRRGWS